MPSLEASVLEQFSKALFLAVGIGAEDAELVSSSLVAANLRGLDSHGVMRIPYYY